MTARTILSWLVALYFLAQLFVSFLAIKQGVTPLVEAPDRAYEDKMRLQLGGYYDLLKFVQEQTPRNATLLIDSPLHAPVDLYFLYPRKVFYERDLIARMQSIDYIVLTGDAAPPKIEGTRLMLDDERGLIRFR